MAIGILLGWLALAGSLPEVGRDSVYGVVRDAVSGGALAGVVVDAGARYGTITDERGAYAIASSAPDLRSLRFTRHGFEPFTVDVALPSGRSLRLDVQLNPLPVTLPPIGVAVRADRGPESEIGLRRYTPETLRTDPLVSSDDPLLAAAASGSADAQTGALRALRVHGGSADQNLLLLDGLPVYGLAHLGGSAGVFDPDLLGGVELHTDVPPAEYGGRLSSVVDVALRPPEVDGVHVAGAWSAVAVRQSLSVPLGSAGSLQAAIRRSYRGLFPGDLAEAEQNGFGDALIHASVRGSRDRLSAYFMNSSDNLAFAGSSASMARPTNSFAWSNQTAGLVWRHDAGGGHVLTVRAWQARADAEIAWAAGGVGEQVTSALREPGISIQLSPAVPEAPASFGVSVSRPASSYRIRTATDSLPGSEGSSLSLESAPLLASAFGQGEWRIARAAVLGGGLRVETGGSGRLLLEPRVSARLEVAPRISLLLGYARIHQFVQSLRNEESPLDHAVGAELPVAVGTDGGSPGQSDQLSAEVVVRAGPRSSARVHGYTRALRDVLAVPLETTGPFARGDAPVGRGTARGFEAEFLRSGGRVDLHVVMGTESARREVGGGSYVPGALRSRWLVSGVGYHFDDRTIGRLTGSVASGTPTTPVSGQATWDSPDIFAVGQEIVGSPEVVGGAFNRDRLPSYWRVDARLTRDWRVHALGRMGVLTSSVGVSNLFNVRNPLAYAAGAAGAPRALTFPSRTLDVQLGWRF